MKRILFLLNALLTCLLMWAHDFEVTNSDGKTIYYEKLTSSTVAVTYKGNSYSSYADRYTDSVVIPSSVTYDGTTYSVTSIGDYAFYKCTGLTSATIPASVTSIGSCAFYNCSGLTSVTIGNSVTSIGEAAFQGCSGLTSVTIPNSVTSIGDWAFAVCSGLTSVTIPDSVTEIGGYAFYNCSDLTSVTIGNSVTSIGGYAFSGCSGLTSVTIPNSVTSIGDYSFYGCSNLTEVTSLSLAPPQIGSQTFSTSTKVVYVYSECVSNYMCDEGWSNLRVEVIGSSATNIDEEIFIIDGIRYKITSYYKKECAVTSLNSGTESYSGEISIPSTVTRNETTYSVTSIGYSAFSSCSDLTSVTIPNSVTYICNCAFSNCNKLTSVTIPESVTSIGYRAFWLCDNLNRVNISDLKAWCGITFSNSESHPLNYNVGTLNNNNEGALYMNGEQISKLIIPATISEIKIYAFLGCTSLTSVTIPNSVTSIGEGAFWGCSGLTSVTIPESVTSIGNNAFRDCSSLTSVTIPESVTSIGDQTFWFCSGLTSVTIPVSVTSIGIGAFSHCTSLTSVTIPESVTSIGNIAFSSCSGLTSVNIPKSVTSIGNEIFSNCTGLANIRSEIIDLDKLTVGYNIFSDVPTSTCKLSVPRSKQSVYASTAPWSSFTNIVEHFITGDANIDYEVSVADVSTTINYIIGNNPDTFDEEAADVSGNGKVNVADATLITNIVLNQPSSAFALPARMPAMFEQASSTSLSMSDVSIDELTGHVSVDNASDFVALQFEVNVPEGLIIENVSSDDNHTVAFNSIGENVYRVIIYSLANAPFQSDVVASFSFSKTGNVEVGSEIDFFSVLVNENINGEINEYQIAASPAYITEPSSIQQTINTNTNIRVKNGELLIDTDSECDVRIVSIDGIVFIKHLIPGTNSISLPKGLYIINGMKVVL